MKTFIPEAITTVEDAKIFLTELYKNGESFHCEDDANDCLEGIATKKEGDQLNKLMDDIYDLPGNNGKHDNSISFCPCGFILWLDMPAIFKGEVNSSLYEFEWSGPNTASINGWEYKQVAADKFIKGDFKQTTYA